MKLLRSDPRSRQAAGCPKAKQDPLDVLSLLDKLKELHELLEQQLADERRHGELQARDKDAAEWLLKDAEDGMQTWKEAAERAEQALMLMTNEAVRLEGELRVVRGQLAESQQPSAQQPSAQQPSAQQPSAQQPSAQQPSAQQPSAQPLVDQETTEPHSPDRELIVDPEEESVEHQGQHFGQHVQEQEEEEEEEEVDSAAQAADVAAQRSQQEQPAIPAQSAQEHAEEQGEAAGDAVQADDSRHATDRMQQPPEVQEGGGQAEEDNRVEGSTCSENSVDTWRNKKMAASLVLMREIMSMQRELEALKRERLDLIVMVAMLVRQLREAESLGVMDALTVAKAAK